MEFRRLLESCAKDLTQVVDEFVAANLPPPPDVRSSELKNVNDPVWKTIRLRSWEVAVIDTPLFQRLRRIRQLGVAELVFPGAGYSRFEHSVGTLQAMETLCGALNSGSQQLVTPREHSLLRLAALLHDIGHCAYSHVSEAFYGQLPVGNNVTLADLRTEVEPRLGHRPSPSELLSAAVVCSRPFAAYLGALRIQEISDRETPDWLATLITGGYPDLTRPFLTQLLTGPFDADKLDYMQRDCLMAGIPLPLDVPRLVDKVRPVRVKVKQLAESAQLAFNLEPDKEVTVLGVALSGARAIEEMLIARVILFDKLYYHSKIRAAESLVRRALSELKQTGLLHDLKSFLVLDDLNLSAFGDPDFTASAQINERAGQLLQALRHRKLPKRAFCFAQPLIAPGTDEFAWTKLSDACADDLERTQLAAEISSLAQELLTLVESERPVTPPEVFISMPDASRVHTSVETFLITNDGSAVPFRAADANSTNGDDPVPFRNHFDVDRWADAYETNKTYGYVFADPRFCVAVGVASEIIFARKFSAFFDGATCQMCKLRRADVDPLLRLAEAKGMLNDVPRLHPPKSALGNSLAKQLTQEVVYGLRNFDGVGGVRINEARVRAWANQFPDNLILDALRMAKAIHIPTREEFVSGVEDILGQTQLPLLWVPLGALHDSGPHWAYYLGDVKNTDKPGVPQAVQLNHRS